MSVFSAGIRGHYYESLLNSSHPQKILAKFFLPKKSRNQKFQNLRSSLSLEIGVAATPPHPTTPRLGFELSVNSKNLRLREIGILLLYCTVPWCTIIRLVSIEDICIAHVQTNIFIIESVCDQWAKLTAMKLWSTKLYFAEFFSCIIFTFVASYLIVSSWWYHGREMEKQVSFTTYRDLHSETALETPSLSVQCGQLRFCWEKK